jgi:hypothetical protein
VPDYIIRNREGKVSLIITKLVILVKLGFKLNVDLIFYIALEHLGAKLGTYLYKSSRYIIGY